MTENEKRRLEDIARLERAKAELDLKKVMPQPIVTNLNLTELQLYPGLKKEQDTFVVGENDK